jgi:hypothetical protein
VFWRFIIAQFGFFNAPFQDLTFFLRLSLLVLLIGDAIFTLYFEYTPDTLGRLPVLVYEPAWWRTGAYFAANLIHRDLYFIAPKGPYVWCAGWRGREGPPRRGFWNGKPHVKRGKKKTRVSFALNRASQDDERHAE